MSGLFITFEGTDGSGKSTQIQLLVDYLINKNFDVLSTREPGGTKISEKIRDIILDKNNSEMDDMTEALLYASARSQLVNEEILPALFDGKIVICDRYIDSSIVYQGYARGLGERIITSINKYATSQLMPDITFLLSLKPEASIKRKKAQAELDRIEMQKEYFHNCVYRGYLRLAKKNPQRIKVIDANKSIEQIHNEIIGYINELFNEEYHG